MCHMQYAHVLTAAPPLTITVYNQEAYATPTDEFPQVLQGCNFLWGLEQTCSPYFPKSCFETFTI